MCSHSPHLFDFVVTVSNPVLSLLAFDVYKTIDSSEAMVRSYLHHGYSNV